MRLLVIEDDKQIGSFLKENLEAECFAVDWAKDGEKGLSLAHINQYDLIILDNILPKKTGAQVCEGIRKDRKHVPIIVLSVVSDAESKVSLLDFGADDYLNKPFSFKELKARIKALLRRPSRVQEEISKIGDLSIDFPQNKFMVKGKKIHLTRKEFMLLEYFIKNKGRILTRGMIAEHVWDMSLDPFSNTIEAHIRSLRKKISAGSSQKLIHTIPGRGYRLEEDI